MLQREPQYIARQPSVTIRQMSLDSSLTPQVVVCDRGYGIGRILDQQNNSSKIVGAFLGPGSREHNGTSVHSGREFAFI